MGDSQQTITFSSFSHQFVWYLVRETRGEGHSDIDQSRTNPHSTDAGTPCGVLLSVVLGGMVGSLYTNR